MNLLKTGTEFDCNKNSYKRENSRRKSNDQKVYFCTINGCFDNDNGM